MGVRVSLTDAVNEARRERKPKCSVAKLRDGMDAATRAELDGLLADPAVTATILARGLATLGHRIATNTLSRHRRGDCSCGRG